MASLALGVAGAYAGSFFGPLGASIGWTLGAAVGGLLDPPKQEGPRLTDLKLQASSYGQPIPRVWGTDRLAGNVMWTTDLVEHKHNQRYGKGGGSVTTYSYTANFAVLLCQGPIDGIVKIWADGRLIYDGTNKKDCPQFTLYKGEEDQDVDPTMEAELGAGNVPAFRGYAYVVFADADLSPFGNRIPTLSFEVTTGLSRLYKRVAEWTEFGPAGTSTPSYSVSYDGKTILLRWWTYTLNNAYWRDHVYYTTQTRTEYGTIIDEVTTDVDDPYTQATDFGIVYRCTNNVHLWVANNIYSTRALYEDETSITDSIPTNHISAEFVASWDGATAFFLGDVNPGGGGGAVLRAYTVATGAFTGHAVTFDPASQGDQFGVSMDSDGTVWVSGYNLTWHYSYDDDDGFALIDSWDWGALGLGPHNTRNYMFCGGRYAVPAFPNVAVGAITADSPYFSSVGVIPYTSGLLAVLGPQPLMTLGPCVGLGDGLAYVRDGLVSVCTDKGGGVLLSEIVTDLSEAAALDAAEIDVTELQDLVDGFKVANQMTARAAIETLMPAYYFDAVESDGKVKFPKRGRQALADIPDDELAAYEIGAERPAAVVYTRGQEADLPKSVFVNYTDPALDYQPNDVSAIRQHGNAQASTTLQLPVVMDDIKAREIASAQLFAAWLERDRAEISVPRSYAWLDPTDVLTVQGITYRATQVDATPYGPQKMALTRMLPTMWGGGGGNPGTGSGNPGGQEIALKQLTRLSMLDIPYIDDAGYQSVAWAAVCGYDRPEWPGCLLYKSTDGTNFEDVVDTTGADTLGVTTTTLGSFAGGNVFDETNSVTVTLAGGAGDLESATRAEVLAGANEAVIGDEIVQFRTATLVSAGTYMLSGLLRGRRGTEWAIGTHATGERFVLLPAQIRVDMARTDLDVAETWAAATLGSTLTDAVQQTMTWTGRALLPYSPVKLAAGKVGNDWTLSWTRRARINGDWVDWFDVPLDEVAERYVVNVYTSGSYATVAGTVDASTTSATITAAQQTTWFGSPQSTLYWGVAQVGQIGPGYEARA